MDINVENLIKVIRKHCILYDNNNKEYYNRSKKRQTWENVCAMLNSQWQIWDNKRKLIYCKEVQKKWQSLRDCFRRELIVQKTLSGVVGKKKYKYFDDLEFLTPFTHCIYNETSTTTASSLEGKTLFVTDPEGSSNSKDPLLEANFFRKRKLSEAFGEETTERGENQADVGNNSRRFIDDDEAFLYSLLPSFKEYDFEQKYLLRIELMKTILKFKQSQNNYCIVKKEVDEEQEEYNS